MANETMLKTRHVQKHDIEANWILAGNANKPFIPLKGELIIYDPDATHNKSRIKIGDGETNVNKLHFFNDEWDYIIDNSYSKLSYDEYDGVYRIGNDFFQGLSGKVFVNVTYNNIISDYNTIYDVSGISHLHIEPSGFPYVRFKGDTKGSISGNFVGEFDGFTHVSNLSGHFINCTDLTGCKGVFTNCEYIDNCEGNQSLPLLIDATEGSSVFTNCKYISNIDVVKGNSYSNGRGTFNNCSVITNVTISNISLLDNHVFINCDHLSNVKMINVTNDDEYEGRSGYYNGCTYVDAFTCDHYIEEKAGKDKLLVTGDNDNITFMDIPDTANDFDFIITKLGEITETNSFGYPETRRETLNDVLADKYGKVYVAVSYLDGTVVEVPEAISYIEFQKDLFKGQGGFELKGSGKGCQVVRNFWADDSYITGFKGGVEHCHSYSTFGFGITDCNNISHCDVSELTNCNNINDCTAYVASNQFSTISGCNYINNLIIDNYDMETYEFKNCSYLSNIAIKNSDQADIHFVYNNCTHVDPYTCYGFITDEEIGKVRTLTTDGSINVIDPADKTYVDTSITDSLAGYATENYVQAKIAEAELAGGDVDLSEYATKDDLNNAFTDNNITTIDAGRTSITALMPADQYSDIFIGYKLDLEQPEITGIAVTSDGVIFMVDSQEVARLQSGKPFIDVDLSNLNPESIVIGEGVVNNYGVAGGTTDKSFVAGLVGSTLANLVTLTKSKAEGDFSISIGANNIAGSDGGITLGYDNTSGRRGYRLYKVNRETRWIHIGSDELDPDRQYGNETEADKYWELDGEVGDKLLFCFGDNEYIAEVEEIYPSSMDGKGGVKLKEITWPESEGTSAQVFNLTRPDTGLMYWGWGGTAIGASNKAYGTSSLAYGYKNTADDSFGVAFGQENEVGYTAFTAGLLNNASGKGSAALGKGLTVSGEFAFAEGADNTASGTTSHAEGRKTVASADATHTEGYNTKATKFGAHAEGWEAVASGAHAHAEGSTTEAAGESSHAEGISTVASGQASHSEGYFTQATADWAHAGGRRAVANHTGAYSIGNYTQTGRNYQFVVGEYNETVEDALFVVGNGSWYGDGQEEMRASRSNAFVVNTSGDVVIAGSLKIGNTTFTEDQLIKILNFIDSIEG